MKYNNLALGRKGEELACKYLCDNQYLIIEKNYRSRYAEIDLVALDNEALVFVEVKTCLDAGAADPEDSLNKRKLNKLKRNAATYAAIKQYNCPMRIDAVCIVLSTDGKTRRLTHYKNITA